jgi:hypothetical protein
VLDSRIEWKLIGDHCQTNHRESHRQSQCVARDCVYQTRAQSEPRSLRQRPLSNGMTIVTRNVADFEATGASVFNPWE